MCSETGLLCPDGLSSSHPCPQGSGIYLYGREDGKILRTGDHLLDTIGPMNLIIHRNRGSLYKVCTGQARWGHSTKKLRAKGNTVFSKGVLLGILTHSLCSDCAISNPCSQIFLQHCIIALARARWVKVLAMLSVTRVGA